MNDNYFILIINFCFSSMKCETIFIDFMSTIGLSYVLHLMVEQPINNIIELTLKPKLHGKYQKCDEQMCTVTGQKERCVLKYVFHKDSNFENF